ncbi:MAG: hypothetical protein M1830_005923, partial [Pleopsidium flavum]
LPPISTTNSTPVDVEDLTRRTREIMLEELVNLTESTRGQKVTTSKAAQADGAPKTSSAEYGRKHVDGQIQEAL